MSGKSKFGIPIEFDLLQNGVVRGQLVRNDGPDIPELKTSADERVGGLVSRINEVGR